MKRVFLWCMDELGWFFTEVGDKFFCLYDVPFPDGRPWKWYDHCWSAIGTVPIRIGSWFYRKGDVE